MTAKANLTVQAWGNSLAVRIPARVARAARLVVGQPVSVELSDDALIVRPTGRPKLTLEQKLKAFDPALHGGEAMTNGRVGAEIF
jgi:antitoxin MazE